MITAEAESHQSFRVQVIQDLLTLKRFARRYGPSVVLLIVAAVIGWAAANSVSNYTNGGWEMHIERRFNDQTLINIHLHHWYYGIPLFFIALFLIQVNAMASTFVFGLGQALSAHSFINEHGIPSIIEGGTTWAVPPEIYFPIVTAFSVLYAIFLIRREEWLARAREREEIAASYLGPRARIRETFGQVDEWARRHFTKKKLQHDPDTQIWYGEWRGLDAGQNGEWQIHYTVTPYEPDTVLWVFSLEHIPIKGSVGLIDDWMHELDDALGPGLQPLLLRELQPRQERALAGK
jgi:hypothetical protein